MAHDNVSDVDGEGSFTEVVADGENNAPGQWKICKAPSNRSKCTRCNQIISVGDLRIELGGASAIVSDQVGSLPK